MSAYKKLKKLQEDLNRLAVMAANSGIDEQDFENAQEIARELAAAYLQIANGCYDDMTDVLAEYGAEIDRQQDEMFKMGRRSVM